MFSTLREKLGRFLPIDGWSIGILLWTAAFGVILRGWRIVDFLWESDDWSDLWWWPKSLGVDLGFAVLVWLCCGWVLMLALGRMRLVRALAWLWAVGVLAAVLFFGVTNALSFHVSGSALTLQRLRGDDGATARDMDKFAWGDVWPVLVLTVASVATLLAVLLFAGRIERWPVGRRRAVAVGVVAASAVTFAIYALVWDGRDRGYGRHPVGVFVESVRQDFGEKPDFIREFSAPPVTDEALAALLQPDRPASPVPLAPKRVAGTAKNVIVFLSEGVPYEHTSLDPRGPDTTPRLKARAAREGLQMQRFYSPFHKSIQALFSLACGDFPTPNGISISELNPRIDCKQFPEVMSKAGVRTALVHGGYFSFYDKTAFLGSRGFELFVDAPALRESSKHPSGEPWFENNWGIDDRAMVKATLEWIDGLPKDERFAAVLIPITAHYPYAVPKDVPLSFGSSKKLDRFYNAVSFLDLVFDELMNGLEQRGLLDDTLVMFLADHGESPYEPPRESNVDRAMYEYDVRVPLVMFNRAMFPKPEKNERLAAIPDVLPTVLDAMGIPDVRERQGRSFLADDWREQRVFLGASRSNVKQVGFIDGNDKFILDMSSGRTELYDLVRDPDELTNIAGRRVADVKRWTDVVLTWNNWQRERIRDWPSIDQALNAQLNLARDFTVTVLDSEGRRAECTKISRNGETGRHCEGFPRDTFAGVESIRVSGRERACMWVMIPPGGGSVTMEVHDKDYFHVVTNMRSAFGPGRKNTDATVTITGHVDDRPPITQALTRNWRNRRLMFGAPHKSLSITLESPTDVRPAPVCLFFGDASFRPRAGAFDFDADASPFLDGPDDEVRAPADADADEDDGHDDLPQEAADPPTDAIE